jgi:hypothetical protein
MPQKKVGTSKAKQDKMSSGSQQWHHDTTKETIKSFSIEVSEQKEGKITAQTRSTK